MIKSVSVINDKQERLILELDKPWQHGIAVESITGIGPNKANINMTELATNDGAIYNSARLSARNIVLSLILLGYYDAEEARHLTYQFFPIKKKVRLIFETDNREVMIDGYVESNEPDIFKERETAQISIVCENPYFYAENKTYMLNSVDPQFSFPFSNESLTDPVISLGEIVFNVGGYMIYDGDVETGAIIRVQAYGPVRNLKIRSVTTNITMSLDTSKIRTVVGGSDNDIIAYDEIYISTIQGSRYVRLLRGGKWYNILSTLPKMSDWITIKMGVNVFEFEADAGDTNCAIEIQSNTLYQGV